MRNTILSVLEGALNILIIVMTIGGFVAGGTMGGVGSMFTGGPSFSFLGALIGGLLGFLWGVLGTGIAFLLLDIRDAIKRQADLAEQQQRQQSQQSWQQQRQQAGAVYSASPAYPSTQPAASATPAFHDQNATQTLSSSQTGQASADYIAAQRALHGNTALICPRCGEANRPNRRVCWTCGAPLVADTPFA